MKWRWLAGFVAVPWVAYAQLVPMQVAPDEGSGLKPMQTAGSDDSVALVPMEKSVSGAIIGELIAMENVSKTEDAPLVAMEKHDGAGEVALVAMETPKNEMVVELKPMQPSVDVADNTARTEIATALESMAQTNAKVAVVGRVVAVEGTAGNMIAGGGYAGGLLRPGSVRDIVATGLMQVAAEDGTGSQGVSGKGNGVARGGMPAMFVQPPSIADLPENAAVPVVGRSEDDVLLASVIVNKHVRNGVMQGYTDPKTGKIWLPLKGVAMALQMVLEVNARAGLAQGWYEATDNTVMLNLAAGTLRVDKQTYQIAGDAERHSDDVYVTLDGLKTWFGVKGDFDYGQLQLALTTPQPLPQDVKLARDEQWRTLARQQALLALPSDTQVLPYSNFSMPALRFSTNVNLNRNADGVGSGSGGLNIQAQNDIMGMSNELTLGLAKTSGGGVDVTGGSLLLQKSSQVANLLGPLGARYVGVGDITTNPLALSNLANSGRGVRVSNLPGGAVDNPDQYVLTGAAPVNWDIEVYQEKSLLTFGRVDESGRYSFNALPLRTGENTFKLVFYGPNGERQEKVETVFVGDNIPPRGSWYYDAALLQPGLRTLPLVDNNVSNSTVAQAQLTYGLSRDWAAVIGGFATQGNTTQLGTTLQGRNEAPQQGVNVGLRGSVMDKAYITGDVAGNEQGQSVQATLRTALTDKVNLRLSRAQNMGYAASQRDELTNTAAAVSLPLKLAGLGIQQDYGYRRSTYQTQDPLQAVNQRVSMGLGRVSLANTLEYQVQGHSRNTVGNVELATRAMNMALRGGLSYRPGADQPLQQLTAGAQMPLPNAMNLNVVYNQNLADAKTATLGGGLNWQTGKMALGLLGQANSRGDMQVGLNMALAVAPAAGGGYVVQKPGDGLGRGRAQVRVFMDENDDGRYEEGEQLLSGINIYNRGRGSRSQTNADGLAQVNDLTPGSLSRLEVDIESLPNIYLRPVSDSLNVIAHTGNNGRVDLAMRVLGEIDGQLEGEKNGVSQPLRDLKLYLVSADGRKVAATLSAYDGYFSFSEVPMGTYTVMVDGPGVSSEKVVLTGREPAKTVALKLQLALPPKGVSATTPATAVAP